MFKKLGINKIKDLILDEKSSQLNDQVNLFSSSNFLFFDKTYIRKRKKYDFFSEFLFLKKLIFKTNKVKFFGGSGNGRINPSQVFYI